MDQVLWMIMTVILFQLHVVRMQSEETKAVIYSLQRRYCGEQFCNYDQNYSVPYCPVQVPDPLPVSSSSTNTTQLPNSSGEHGTRCNPCAPCSCGDSCQLLGSCCADKHIGGKYYTTCERVLVYRQQSETEPFRYEMVTKCLRDAPNYSDDLAEKCEHGKLGHVEDGRIVTALHADNASVTFRNKYCALCYGVSNFTSWNVYITCKAGFDPGNFSNINSMIRSVQRSRECEVSQAMKSDYLQIPGSCDSIKDMITTCNETGEWREYNRTVEEACDSYYNPTFDMLYRNIFCFLCNGEAEWELECPPLCEKRLYKDIVIRPFAALLNFDMSDAEVLRKEGTDLEESEMRRIGQQVEHQCRESDIYDSSMKRCREVYCPLSDISNSSRCVKLVPNQHYVFTLVNVTTYFNERHPMTLNNVHSERHEEVIASLTKFIQQKGFFIDNCDYTGLAIIRNNTLFTIGAQLSLKLFLLLNFDLETSRLKLKETLELPHGSNIDNMFAKFEIGHRAAATFLFINALGFGGVMGDMLELDQLQVLNVPLQFNVSCPMVKVEDEEIKLVNDSVFLRGHILRKEDYFRKSAGVLFVCKHVLSEVSPNRQPVTSVDPSRLLVGQILTGVCLSCSLLCLFLTLLVYILLRELHTVPGLNLILLTSSLFVAQSLYLFGAGTVSTPTICTVLAVLIHYFWLVSFAWMNICCIHMFRVFNSVFSSLDFIRNKYVVVMKYSGFAYGIPLLIVTTTLVSTFLLSNQTAVAYGGPSLCFISTGIVSIIAFGVPTALTVVINAALLISTIVSLRSKRASTTRVGKHSEISDISKFFKLSSITALAWVFGFLGYFITAEWLLYLFTVLTAGQGVFIFLSFVVSRRILKMIHNTLGCPRRFKSHSETFGDTNKIPQTSSNRATQEMSARL